MTHEAEGMEVSQLVASSSATVLVKSPDLHYCSVLIHDLINSLNSAQSARAVLLCQSTQIHT